MKKVGRSVEETEAFAREFVEALSPQLNGAVLVGLSGDLGSGKTAFVKGVAKAFGVTDEVTSPTFVIEKIYKLEGQKFEHLIHIDAYRLEGGRELRVLGFEKVLNDPKNVIFLEWPEQVKDIVPENVRMLRFTFIDEKTREIEFT